MNADLPSPSLTGTDDFALIRQFRQFLRWWMELDKVPPPPNLPEPERSLGERADAPILVYYRNLIAEFPSANLSDALCDSLCFDEDEPETAWWMESYRVPPELRSDLIPVLIHNHEVDAGTLVCLRASSTDRASIDAVQDGEVRRWKGTIGSLLVAHGLSCLTTNSPQLLVSEVPPSCSPRSIFDFWYGVVLARFSLDPRGVLIRTMQYAGHARTDCVLRSPKIGAEIGLDPRAFGLTSFSEMNV